MFCLGLTETVPAIKMTRVVIIIEDVFLIPSAIRVKAALNILNW